MNNKVYLTITTPDKVFFEGKVKIVTLKTADGYIGLQPNRSPLFSNIEIGSLNINQSGDPDYQKFFIGGGLVYADAGQINIITDDVINYNDIDLHRAERDRNWALNELKNKKYSATDEMRLELKLKKALSRIEAYHEAHQK
ncbi:ATP synthase F1 subunit epsilon [Mycoplasmopsis pullorum]|uniref:ATP synthase epsilon chain n=1 Tax=Mycoplasmopsis pullorum TaxID=48003 RepID=A0A1L4FRL7_9BACT|nr:ATP synthase F1 subunit epsilon [Mycoplasmopsis pullorum]APJ38248.1 ATP synthase F1 subunit epsilon [Mycoplasmopsis pullorum]